MPTTSAVARLLQFPKARSFQKREFPRHAQTGLTLPVHSWLAAGKWTAIVMLGMVVLYVVEKYLLALKGTPMRMVADPSEISIRFFGLAHYAVATYLLFTSKKLHNLRGVFMLGLFSLLAVAACFLFYSLGGHTNILAVVAVFFFFLMHALRDEVFFYRLRSGKAIGDEEYGHVYRMLMWLQVAGLCLLAGLLYPGVLYNRLTAGKGGPIYDQLAAIYPADWPLPLTMATVSVPFFLVAAAAAWRIQKVHPGGLVALLRSHAPMSIIVAGTVGMALSAVLIGTWVLNVVIMMHFTGWFVFAVEGIRKQPAEIRQSITWRKPNQWIRRNLVGFWVFHGGLAAFFFLLIALNHWCFAQEPIAMGGRSVSNPLTTLFCSQHFYYWTIAHVTLGFLPKPAGKRR